MPLNGGALKGYRLLVVEDEYLVAAELAAALRQSGAFVLGPVPGMNAARTLALELVPDCVLLDVNLRGERAFELADELRELGIFTVLTTGHDREYVVRRARGTACFQKPLDIPELVDCIRAHAPRSAH
jgi:DNA-binding response OmpR family regulator